MEGEEQFEKMIVMQAMNELTKMLSTLICHSDILCTMSIASRKNQGIVPKIKQTMGNGYPGNPLLNTKSRVYNEEPNSTFDFNTFTNKSQQ